MMNRPSIRFRAAASIVALLGILASTGRADAATESYRVAPPGDHIAICRGEPLDDNVPQVTSPENIGGVCFRWTTSRTSVTVRFNDTVSGSNVGFYYQWFDAAGGFVPGTTTDPVTGEPEPIFGSACSPKTLTVPGAARGMKIWLDIVLGPLDCPDAEMFGIATIGTVTI